MPQTVLILGASGRFGRNAAHAFKQARWVVRNFDRANDDLAKAAQGAEVIVNAWNPPYTEWAKQVPKLHDDVIRAAKQTGATVIVSGNVYVFGAQTPGPWSETTPHNAQNPLGRIRIQMEAAYRRAGVRTIILRAGDFIDIQPSGNWFDQFMTNKLDKGLFTYPGNPDIDHAWAFLPDLCRAAVMLANKRDDLPAYADVTFPGITLSGNDMAETLGRLTGKPVKLKKMPWLPLIIARPFWKMATHLLEMRYLWDTAHRLDGTTFARLLPDFPPTPTDKALAKAIPQGLVQRQINPNQPMAAGG